MSDSRSAEYSSPHAALATQGARVNSVLPGSTTHDISYRSHTVPSGDTEMHSSEDLADMMHRLLHIAHSADVSNIVREEKVCVQLQGAFRPHGQQREFDIEIRIDLQELARAMSQPTSDRSPGSCEASVASSAAEVTSSEGYMSEDLDDGSVGNPMSSSSSPVPLSLEADWSVVDIQP